MSSKHIMAALLAVTVSISFLAGGCRKDPNNNVIVDVPTPTGEMNTVESTQTAEVTQPVDVTPSAEVTGNTTAGTDLPTLAPATDNPATGLPVTNIPTDAVSPTAGTGNTQAPLVGKTALGSNGMPARNTMPTDLYGLSEEQCEAWFSDAVFVGDSLTIGWKNYNALMLQSDPDFFGQTRFLCEGSYGVGHALEPVSDTSLHPIYGGAQHQIWDSIKLMGAKKVFILFGLNDLSIWGVDGSLENYRKVTDNIKNINPGVEIYIISAMYMYRGSERKVLNNANLYKFNCGLNELCNKMGYEFINIASHLIGEDGFVPDEYSSDKYVHQTYKAYAVWADILRSLAARHILGYAPVRFE